MRASHRIETPVATLIVMNAADLTTTTAVASAVAGVGSWFAASWSLRSSKKAAEATASLMAIEQERRWTELTPKFRFILTEGQNGIEDKGQLEVLLLGPIGLDYLDEVVIRIVDEKGATGAGNLPARVSEEEASLLVWGPWEFNNGASAQVSDNRTTVPRGYSRLTGKNWDHLALNRTRPGHWMTGTTPETWRQERIEHFRLAITCRRDPYPGWYLLCDVPRGMSQSR